jgi:tetratricopeptide (TPR) repeat protein
MPLGSFVDSSVRGQSPTHYEDHDLFVEGLDRLTGEARGTVLPIAVNANAVFARLDLELSGYYLLSFEPDLVDRDNKAHDISVQVSRPGVTIRSRPQFKVAASPTTKTSDELLVEALRNPLPLSDVGVKLTTFTYRDDTSNKLKVLISTEIDRAFNPAGNFSLGYIVTDSVGNLAGSQFERQLAVASKDDEGRPQRYTGAVVLDPGIYNVKLAVVDPKGRSGSVERTFEAKLGSGGQLKFGELMLAEVVGRTAKPSIDGRINADTLMAYAEVYSEANAQLQGATVKIEIGKTDKDTPSEIANLSFTDRKYENKRTAEGAVPIALLAAGDYIARAVFMVDGKVVGQATRPFTVTHAVAAAAPSGPAPSTSMSTPGERITFTSKIDSFDRESVLSPRVVSFFVDRMNIVGLPQMPASLTPAIAAAKAGRFVELQQALASAPADHPATAFLQGVAKLSQGDTAAAQESFRTSLKAAPEFFPSAFYMGAALAAAGRDVDAVAMWQTSLITETDAPFVYTLLGDAMLRLGRTADAIGLLREAALLWPDADDVMMRFGTALAQGGQAADALKMLDPYLVKHPTDQDRLMLAMRLIYQAKSDGKPIDSVENDRARFNRYFAAYEKTGGPQLALAADWKKIVDR